MEHSDFPSLSATCVFNLLLYLALNASNNADKVSALDRQNISKYSAGPCEYAVQSYNTMACHKCI